MKNTDQIQADLTAGIALAMEARDLTANPESDPKVVRATVRKAQKTLNLAVTELDGQKKYADEAARVAAIVTVPVVTDAAPYWETDEDDAEDED